MNAANDLKSERTPMVGGYGCNRKSRTRVLDSFDRKYPRSVAPSLRPFAILRVYIKDILSYFLREKKSDLRANGKHGRRRLPVNLPSVPRSGPPLPLPLLPRYAQICLFYNHTIDIINITVYYNILIHIFQLFHISRVLLEWIRFLLN